MGRTKHGTRITTADKIRADLKAQGYSSRKISVREPHHGDVTVTIRDAGVKLADIKAIADVYRHVRYCEASGEILLGGNTYVEVTYDRDVIRPYAELVAGLLAGIGQGYGISIGDLVLVWTHEPTSGHRTVSKVEGPGDLYRMYAGWGTSEPTAADFMGAAEEIARDLLGRGVEVKHNPRPAPAPKAPLCVTCNDTGAVYTAGQVSVACPACSPDPEPEPPTPAPEDSHTPSRMRGLLAGRTGDTKFQVACREAAETWLEQNQPAPPPPEPASATSTISVILFTPIKAGDRIWWVLARTPEAALDEVLRESEDLGFKATAPHDGVTPDEHGMIPARIVIRR